MRNLIMTSLAVLILSSHAVAQSGPPPMKPTLPQVVGVERNKINNTDDLSSLTLHLSYAGCDRGQLELDVELGPVDSKKNVIRQATIVVRNIQPSLCEKDVRTSFEVSVREVMEIARKKADAVDPNINLWINSGFNIGNPIALTNLEQM